MPGDPFHEACIAVGAAVLATGIGIDNPGIDL